MYMAKSKRIYRNKRKGNRKSRKNKILKGGATSQEIAELGYHFTPEQIQLLINRNVPVETIQTFLNPNGQWRYTEEQFIHDLEEDVSEENEISSPNTDREEESIMSDHPLNNSNIYIIPGENDETDMAEMNINELNVPTPENENMNESQNTTGDSLEMGGRVRGSRKGRKCRKSRKTRKGRKKRH